MPVPSASSWLPQPFGCCGEAGHAQSGGDDEQIGQLFGGRRRAEAGHDLDPNLHWTMRHYAVTVGMPSGLRLPPAFVATRTRTDRPDTHPMGRTFRHTRPPPSSPALSLADRTAITLQQQRFATPSTVLADLTGISDTTIRKAIKQTQPLLATAGHTAEPTGIKLDTATDAREYATNASQHAAS
jgi:hypothetical protein